MDAMLGLSAVSFVTSVIAATVGIGGGLGLLAVMPSFVPISAVVPLHGVTQLASNASRFIADHRHAEIRLLPAYFGELAWAVLSVIVSWVESRTVISQSVVWARSFCCPHGPA